MSELDLRPRKKTEKVVLNREDDARLREWQTENLRLTWCERPASWEIEGEVIGEMKPPLNAAGNSAHPFYATVKASRAAFRGAAVVPTDILEFPRRAHAIRRDSTARHTLHQVLAPASESIENSGPAMIAWWFDLCRAAAIPLANGTKAR